MKLNQLFNHKTRLYKNGLNESIIKYVDFNKKILDVGCCEGTLGKYLKQHKQAVVFAIDISSQAITQAQKNLDQAFTLNIETDRLPFPQKSFDVIICADILEHLFDPLAVLKKLKPFLKNNGIFILSIPNIANIKIRWNLLLGRFYYQKDGIMDDSHVRFFTRKTSQKLVADAGLKILALDYSPGFEFFFLKGRVLKIKILKTLLYQLTKLSPSLFCAQFIIVAQL
ncbi:MAG: class I SAM-dependent methyltransferase [Candidatus Beckwithbacteria bacterium]|nr:class I SAM-dependent methyltransferase [Candidatus Beckwithbacteria bacterium]